MTYQTIALSRLVKLMGDRRGSELFRTIIQEQHLEELRTADDLMIFAVALMARGGVYQAVGRAVKIQALLDGAVEQPEPLRRVNGSGHGHGHGT